MHDAIARVGELDRKLGFRPVVRSSRSVDAGIDANQMPVKTHKTLRVTQKDVDEGRASSGDIGKFWFVPGYSRVGGGDVVPTV